MNMKLRKIGNSLGTTFTQEILAKAGISEGQELEVIGTLGEIKIRPAAGNSVIVEFSAAEAKALAGGKLDSKSGESALNKVRRVMNKS
jgi:antitoxin component of MazEF toxin-antitoxin module